MRNSISIKLIFVIMVFSLFLPVAEAATQYVIGELNTPVDMPENAINAKYVGADECKTCHPTIYDNWKTTGHAYKLTTPDEILAIRPDLPFPDGYNKDDILYIIGGWGWKARYIGLDGFIITKTGENHDIDGMNQYNVVTKEWVDYSPGEAKKYDCTKCHNTGSSYDSNQDNLAGIEGSWEYRGIQCEACHGPGSEHVAQGGGEGVAINVNTNASMCGLCHRRGGEDDKIPASGNFVQHHEQYLDFLASGKMSALDCVTCHDPHMPVHVGATNTKEGKGIIMQCAQCHQSEEAKYAGTVMQMEGVTCVDCHMPKAAKSAIAVSEYEGDVRSHVFRMNLAADAEYIYTDPADDKQYANPYMTLEYVCLPCHADEDKAWAAENAPNAMTLKTEVATMAPTATQPSPGFGLLISVGMLLAVYLFRRR
jgi:hypothetical protein